MSTTVTETDCIPVTYSTIIIHNRANILQQAQLWKTSQNSIIIAAMSVVCCKMLQKLAVNFSSNLNVNIQTQCYSYCLQSAIVTSPSSHACSCCSIACDTSYIIRAVHCIKMTFNYLCQWIPTILSSMPQVRMIVHLLQSAIFKMTSCYSSLQQVSKTFLTLNKYSQMT